MLDIVKWVDELIRPFRNFVMDNYGNPLMWFGFLLIGMAIFSSVFSFLHPND